jgi:hypothetical protein
MICRRHRKVYFFNHVSRQTVGFQNCNCMSKHMLLFFCWLQFFGYASFPYACGYDGSNYYLLSKRMRVGIRNLKCCWSETSTKFL